MLASRGVELVDPGGKPVVLKGCNLGNWLILESWMFGGTLREGGEPFHDQAALLRRLRDRFGDARAESLMDAFRASYVTPRDFELVRSFGFNCVRLPFDYRLLEDDAAPGTLRPDAFEWLDRAIDMAEASGAYVILDMHGVPGGQSGQDHTGESGQNKLWRDEAMQRRTIDLWRAIAERYKTRGAVAAYDVINEPYGDYREDVRPVLRTLVPRIAEAIRATGDQHVIYYPGALNGGVAFYGDPHAGGMTNVGFTEHYYPGLFGSRPALETHARLLGQELPAKQAFLERLGTPYLVGEFNVVLASEDPNRLMRAYYDRFAAYGWASTMWSYKLLKNDAGAGPSAWYMVTNAAALPTLDVATDSADAIERFFKSLATSPIAVNAPLRDALTTATPAPLYLAKYEPLPTTTPVTPSTDPAGYASRDVGGATPGHTRVRPDGAVEVVAGGTDINAQSDSFRFVSRPADGDAFEVRATILSFVDSNQYAKAGAMARWGRSADAAMAMVNVFPDGTIALISRAAAGGSTVEHKVAAGVTLPVQLRLSVAAGKATASYRTTRGGAWLPAGVGDVPHNGDARVGLAVCAHVDAALTTVTARLDVAGDAALPVADDAPPAGVSLLKNGSFEQPGAEAELAEGWNRWGDWINRETTWSPTKSGPAVLGYHHWQVADGGGSSGVWQDVKVVPGRRYAFTIFAQHDGIAGDAKDAKTIELRLEAVTPDGQITLNGRDFDVAHLATGQTWSRLSVSGTATTDTLRVLAVINPADEAPRGGAIKLDAATLTPATDGR